MEYSSLKKIRFSTMQLLAMGFIATIFLGGILLTLPISNTQPIRFIDALFTATSAVCVTGLVTVVPAVQFTVFGKVILLILIQIGGLGVIACVTGFFIILKRKITVRERVIIQESYNSEYTVRNCGVCTKDYQRYFFSRRNRRASFCNCVCT